MKRIMGRKGFTLIELIVVILIIGILATIAVVGFQSITSKAHDAALAANAKQVTSALAADAVNAEATSVQAYLEGPALDPDGDGTADFADVNEYLEDRFPGVTFEEYTAGELTIVGSNEKTVVLDITGAVPQQLDGDEGDEGEEG